MKPEFFREIEQRSPEWHALRAGIITASDYQKLMAKTDERGGRKTLINRVAGEIITGNPAESYENDYMRRGREQEAQARTLYALKHKCDPELVGFVKKGRTGCSPDAQIGKDCGLEIKTEAAHLLIETHLRDEFPAKHKAQVQGTLDITGWKWIDLVIFCPGMPLFVKRATRDELYIRKLRAEIESANAEIDNIVKRIKARA